MLNICQILNVLKKHFSLKHVTFTLQLSFGLFTFLFSKLSKLDRPRPSWVRLAFWVEKKWKLKLSKIKVITNDCNHGDLLIFVTILCRKCVCTAFKVVFYFRHMFQEELLILNLGKIPYLNFFKDSWNTSVLNDPSK